MLSYAWGGEVCYWTRAMWKDFTFNALYCVKRLNVFILIEVYHSKGHGY